MKLTLKYHVEKIATKINPLRPCIFFLSMYRAAPLPLNPHIYAEKKFTHKNNGGQKGLR